MKKPIDIDCILCLNMDEINDAERLELKKPEEIRSEHPLTFVNIDIIEEPFTKDFSHQINASTYIYSSGRCFMSTWSKARILNKMEENNWF